MDKDKTYLRLFFDMDNTLTRSSTPITSEMKTLLQELPCDIVVTSGQSAENIKKQLDNLPCYVLGQNGNEAWFDTELLWNDALVEAERKEILAHIALLPRTWEVPDENDLIEDRGCSICYSLLGHHAPIEQKEKFDPEQVKRLNLLREYPLTSDTIEVKIGGTTTFDYIKKGRNKGYNITRLCEYKSWKNDNCLYFGDALFPGGNDETVIGIIDTVSVRNPQDTYERLLEFKDRWEKEGSTAKS
jgi:HAD superfamily hydrolase (TIGR01484 family)